MPSYWAWLVLLSVSWVMALNQLHVSSSEMAVRLVCSAAFFGFYFLSSLLKKNQMFFLLNMIAAAVFVMISLWPTSSTNVDLYLLLIYSLLVGKVIMTISPRYVAVYGILLVILSFIPYFLGYHSTSPSFLLLLVVLISVAFYSFLTIYSDREATLVRNEAFLSEYRKMKRRIASDEKAARQEERTQIARDIHDSVGHKLTALMMQLEVARLQADEPTASKLSELKELAKESLEETRSAVKALQLDEVGGLPAIINLIRKLEAENFLRIQFSLKPGVFSAPLGNEQMIVIYRAVQEALTNMMRHSEGRDVTILFEAPAQEVFRFEVINPLKQEKTFTEGFGLLAMRERIEKVGGNLDVYQANQQFIVRGALPLHQRGEKK
ncbi:sensor histidine kinase [Bacillus sp. FJAT-45037]|uniref:sensor histidine kinase n=1 Tax=Bacillus sp. FJAT-45037 TaxID=2011007 RepID=UPI000C2346CF|nr:sensor histidine kinase [Bacillus sp. FJAT-45037]